jgi:biotin-[acetyl-CoA-carboxylase] ligase BirA-like protein
MPKPIFRYHFSEISSTNDYARILLNDGSIISVTADFQTQGRGRNKNIWYGSYGNNLYMSLGIKHQKQLSTEQLSAFQSIGALAVKNTLTKLTNGLAFKLKYPNDVFIEYKDLYRKISGVLVEHGFSGSFCAYTIIGIGVNVNETQFETFISKTAVSLKQLGFSADLMELEDAIITEFTKLNDLDFPHFFELLKNELNIIGKDIQILGESGVFQVVKILPDGRLELKEIETNKKRIIDNGDSIRYNLD